MKHPDEINWTWCEKKNDCTHWENCEYCKGEASFINCHYWADVSQAVLMEAING